MQWNNPASVFLSAHDSTVAAGDGTTRSRRADIKHLEPSILPSSVPQFLVFVFEKCTFLSATMYPDTDKRCWSRSSAMMDRRLHWAAEWQAEPKARSWSDRRDMSTHLLPRSPRTLKSVIHVWCVQLRGCRHVLPPPYFFCNRRSLMQEHVHQSAPRQFWWD